ncbi:MAG: VWA domain-containing protein [Planctomycetes bacterium]|nr:VWA domain-containing protein [Planctomycetota bacterium]
MAGPAGAIEYSREDKGTELMFARLRNGKSWVVWALIAAIGWFWTGAARGQGVLIIVNHPHPVPLPRPWPPPHPRPPRPGPPRPEPPISYRIKELSVQAKVADQVARVQVTQSFVNTGSAPMEASFVFPLPYDGAVDRLTFLVDGQEIEAKLLPAGEARAIYEGHVRRNQDPALLEWVGFGMFRTSVFPVPPGAERKVTLRYNQLLRRQGRLVDFLFPLSTAKYTASPIEKLAFEIAIESAEPIKSVYSPTVPINVRRSDAGHALVTYSAEGIVPATDLRLFYDVDASPLGASLVSYRPERGEDGYFLLLASPEFQASSEQIARKTVVLVVDRSGSMSGKKIEQAKDALRFVLNNLREGDLFNIVAYDSDVESFRPELQRYGDATRKEAIGFVEGIYAGGSTNINQALTTSLAMLNDDSQPTYVLFLTDGLPTVGERNEAKIVANAAANNKIKARIMTFGVGYDVNSRLLDRIVYENNGVGEYVRPDEDIEQHVSAFYNRISAPLMTNVSFAIDVEGASAEDGSSVNRVYPKRMNDLFAGEQIVLVGRYRKPGDGKVTIRGRIGADSKQFDFPAKLVEHSADQSNGFVERLWATRRIGEIIDELDLSGKNDELIKELVALSTTHGILTPYTSFLADETRRADLADASGLNERVRDNLGRLAETEGRSGFAQRAAKQEFKNAQAAPMPAGGGGFGVADGSAGMALRDLDTGEAIVVNALRQVGNTTLYKQGQLWIASNAREIDVEKHKDRIQDVARFSDAYFRLVADNSPDENSVLASQMEGEELLIRLRGQVYRIQ